MVDDDGDSDGDGGDDYGADDGVDDEGDDDEDDYDDDNDVMTMMTMMTIKIMIVIGTVTCNELVSILRCEWTSAMSFSASLPQLCPFMSPCPPSDESHNFRAGRWYGAHADRCHACDSLRSPVQSCDRSSGDANPTRATTGGMRQDPKNTLWL